MVGPKSRRPRGPLAKDAGTRARLQVLQTLDRRLRSALLCLLDGCRQRSKEAASTIASVAREHHHRAVHASMRPNGVNDVLHADGSVQQLGHNAAQLAFEAELRFGLDDRSCF